MSDETVQRHLEAVIRRDGRGELRDGDTAQPMTGASDDELRGLMMQAVMQLAAETGEPVRLRTVDVDGVYHLVVHPDGEIAEEGSIDPLSEDDLTLWVDSPEATLLDPDTGLIELPRASDLDGAEGAAPDAMGIAPDAGHAGPEHHDGGYAAAFGDQAGDANDVDPHETIQLPRPDMMRHEPPAVTGMRPIIPPRDSAPEPAPVAEGDDAGEWAVDAHAEAYEIESPTDAVGGDAADAETWADAPAGDAHPDAGAHETDPAANDAWPAAAEPGAQAAGGADEAGAGEPGFGGAGMDAGQVPAPDAEAGWAPSFPRGARGADGGAPTAQGAGAGAVADFGAGGGRGIGADIPAVPGAPGSGVSSGLHDARPDSGPVPAPSRPGQPPRVISPALAGGPTLGDFLADNSERKELPATRGWRANLRKSTGGLITLGPGSRERSEREEIASIQRPFDGSKTIVVVNPKGGAHKTTTTLMIAATFGMHRGGYTLAWDNNETRGTLGWRSHRAGHNRTAVDLLRQLSHFEISGGATIADVDRFVRNQGDAKFDVLASDDDAASAAIIDAEAFSRLHRTLSRFYRVLVIDTGNNMRASNWEAALDVADQLVIVSTAREDTAASAAWLADGLRERGHAEKLANAVTILSSPSAKEDPQLQERLRQHFAQLTRAVVEVPYDEEFVGGGELDIPHLRQDTRDAWRSAAAVIARGL